MREYAYIILASLLVLTACEKSVKNPIAVSSVTVNPTTLALTEGETGHLVATVLPDNAGDKALSWDSSNSSVAIVHEGTVEAIAPGIANITAKAGGKSASCSVTVLSKSVPVTSISLNESNLSLVKGERVSLTATVLPENATEKELHWSSSNEAVATVSDSGEVLAIGGGSAIVTVTADGKSATCSVEVSVPLESISIIPEEGLFIDDTASHVLQVQLIPEDATIAGLEWFIDDASIILFTESGNDASRLVQARKNGETRVRVKVVGADVEASVPVTVKVKVTSMTLGAEWYSPRLNSWSWQQIYYAYETTYNVPLYLTIDYSPDIAFIDDAEITIEDDKYVAMNERGDDLITKAKSGDTRIEVSFPYSNISQSFTLTVKEFLSEAGVKNINQSEVNYQTILKMSFGGHIYSQVEDDVYYVDNVQLCDDTGRIIGSSMSPTEKISIFRNGTNDVAFSSPFINLTTLYGYGVIQADLYDFLGKCFFYVTYRKNPNEELQARYIYLNSNNWNADYEY